MRYLTPILSLIAVLLAVSVITYAIASALPGYAAEIRVGKRDDLTFEARQQLVDAERKRLGLDKPLPVQFQIWLTKAAQGDFGTQEHRRMRPARRRGPNLASFMNGSG